MAMPIYEYQCDQCEHAFEALVDEGESVTCPRCRTSELKRLLSLPAKPTATAPAGACNADPSLPPCGPTCGRLRR
jgi:putative FmdB family regulatory protein